MFRQTDFGGFLVCCWIGPYLHDVENNSVAISSMLSLENAWIDWTTWKKVKNSNRSNQRKKQLCTCSSLFFLHFFAVVLHDYTVKLPETSQFHVLWRKCRTCSHSLIFYCRSFSSCIGGRQLFVFCHRRYKIFMLSFQQKKCLLRFFSLALDLCRPFSR